jgi:hypothetical protein
MRVIRCDSLVVCHFRTEDYGCRIVGQAYRLPGAGVNWKARGLAGEAPALQHSFPQINRYRKLRARGPHSLGSARVSRGNASSARTERLLAVMSFVCEFISSQVHSN